ncbi:P-loop containing nucleoside triphosphate hydrolase [Pseudocohnilembus persalinus]|uniref:p-loop containing nucleoside triphosphate hydrolase n=1 Tax=Pseudocohnilembus persalinus TaxID=266149 RepID=A0A0V0QFZ1_PSEPJ|nr:P-loop containing nucleoside triphosphate hydrolase [Pseudocohnilembus persalinus]|eukprot:KRX01133.1 P-loop containing nucleoside triphosphate hydrolase [Pseudocohnilembus persalinus]
MNRHHFKIIIIGDSGVGKTCMMMRYLEKKYQSDYSATIGVEFQSKIVKLKDGKSVNVQIWDTAGQESFRAIVKTFFRNSHAIVVVYNIAKKRTFESCDSWLKESSENAFPDALKVLVGAQSDREDREVQYEEGQKQKEEKQYDLFYEISSKNGQNIDDQKNQKSGGCC